jgi:hypothetical protein
MSRVLAVIAGLALVLPPAAAEAQKPPRYEAYVVCSAKLSAPPATECGRKKPKMAIFVSKDKHVTYKICVRFPDRQKLCAAKQDAPKGVKRLNTITTDQKGAHKVTWRVNGTKVATYVIEVK